MHRVRHRAFLLAPRRVRQDRTHDGRHRYPASMRTVFEASTGVLAVILSGAPAKFTIVILSGAPAKFTIVILSGAPARSSVPLILRVGRARSRRICVCSKGSVTAPSNRPNVGTALLYPPPKIKRAGEFSPATNPYLPIFSPIDFAWVNSSR